MATRGLGVYSTVMTPPPEPGNARQPNPRTPSPRANIHCRPYNITTCHPVNG